ncbi:MAG: BrnT family toxin [Casimicrobiaceae bacterium]
MDLARIVAFDWDAGNARKNETHGVSKSQAEQIFFDVRVLMVADPDHSGKESRFHALGVTLDGRLLHVTFTLRSDDPLNRVISAREAHRKERQIYERED